MAASLCALLWVSPAFAQDDAKEVSGDAEQRVEKHGGRFSLLGLECKPEDDDALETTPGSPPLDVDDAATPGCNGWEINIVTSGEIGNASSWEAPLLDINYGIGDNIQLKYEMPYQLNRSGGVTSSRIGPAEFGLKYRFYEDDTSELTMAIYPQFEFAMPGTAAAAAGGGTLTKLPVLLSRKIGETAKGDIMITANAAYNISTDPGTENYVSAAFGVGFPLTAKLAMMLEGSTEQAIGKTMDNVRESMFKANVGVLGRISPHLLWFGSVGRSFASSDADDPNHTCLSLGIRVLAGGP